jgi:DNA helicase II / ATP-dependent DNA helicase PcrA
MSAKTPDRMPSTGDMESLNEAQREAVLHPPDRPLLVLAAAGTGKTQALTCRIAHAIRERHVLPWRILAVTFTNKAAREMRTRAAALSGVPATSLCIGTFHSICVRILRKHGPEVGLSANFTILDQKASTKLATTVAEELGLVRSGASEKQFLTQLSSRIDKWRNEGWEPGDVVVPDTDKLGVCAKRLYVAYRRACLESGSCDFGDLLLHAVSVLRKSEVARDDVSARWSEVLVDEYQDTNAVQLAFLKILCPPAHLTVIGDENQSIYGWRGADVRNILDFATRDFPGARVVKLETNYRSVKSVLDAANAVISNNSQKTDKVLRCSRDRGPPVRHRAFNTEWAEADAVARTIASSSRKAYGDFAVIFRTNSQSGLVESALKRSGIPYTVRGTVRFFDRTEVRDCVAYLKLVAGDWSELQRVLPKGVGAAGWEGLRRVLSRAGVVEGLTSDLKGVVRSVKGRRELHALGEMVAGLEDATAAEALARIVNDVGLCTDLDDERKEHVAQLVDIARREGTGVRDFLDTVALSGSDDVAEFGVNLMTIHASKGLEFPVVFVIGMSEGTFPHKLAVETDLEGERRLCYVALTRARDALYVSYTRKKTAYDGMSVACEPSRFMREMSVGV